MDEGYALLNMDSMKFHSESNKILLYQSNADAETKGTSTYTMFNTVLICITDKNKDMFKLIKTK